MRYVYLSPEVREMNYLQWRKRRLIKFDEEKSVLTFYRKRSAFACRYLFRYRCLGIPRRTPRTDNQASAYVFSYEALIAGLLNQCTCHKEKNVSVRMTGMWKDYILE